MSPVGGRLQTYFLLRLSARQSPGRNSPGYGRIVLVQSMHRHQVVQVGQVSQFLIGYYKLGHCYFEIY